MKHQTHSLVGEPPPALSPHLCRGQRGSLHPQNPAHVQPWALHSAWGKAAGSGCGQAAPGERRGVSAAGHRFSGLVRFGFLCSLGFHHAQKCLAASWHPERFLGFSLVQEPAARRCHRDPVIFPTIPLTCFSTTQLPQLPYQQSMARQRPSRGSYPGPMPRARRPPDPG